MLPHGQKCNIKPFHVARTLDFGRLYNPTWINNLLDTGYPEEETYNLDPIESSRIYFVKILFSFIFYVD